MNKNLGVLYGQGPVLSTGEGIELQHRALIQQLHYTYLKNTAE